MKEQTLVEMKNKIEALTRVMQHLMEEVSYMRDLGVGTFETIKLMPGYDEAIKILTERTKEQNKENDTKLELPVD